VGIFFRQILLRLKALKASAMWLLITYLIVVDVACVYCVFDPNTSSKSHSSQTMSVPSFLNKSRLVWIPNLAWISAVAWWTGVNTEPWHSRIAHLPGYWYHSLPSWTKNFSDLSQIPYLIPRVGFTGRNKICRQRARYRPLQWIPKCVIFKALEWYLVTQFGIHRKRMAVSSLFSRAGSE
jgi:hypothetical protein